MKGKSRQQKGITLIALIITIVVLLILAVVAINSIQDDGMLGHAQNAAGTYNNAVANEQSMLQEYENYLKNYIGGGAGDDTTDDDTTGVSVSGQTWVFNSGSGITHTKNFTETVSFISNGNIFSSISLGYADGTWGDYTASCTQLTYGATEVFGPDISVYGVSTWRDYTIDYDDSPWKTIKFVEGATVSEEFYTWLSANATQSADDTTGDNTDITTSTVSGVWVFKDSPRIWYKWN